MTWHVWVRRLCALVVAVVAAYASYEHQRRFALSWGAEPVAAALWPLSVDGLVVLASVGLLEGGPHMVFRIRWSMWAAFLLGVSVSLLANIAAAPVLAWQSVVVAGWPPVALLLAVELLAVGRARATGVDSPVHAGVLAKADGNDRDDRVLSFRSAVRSVLESSNSALTNSEIVDALRGIHSGISDKRLRANVNNSLWSLRKDGVVATNNGKNFLVSRLSSGRQGHRRSTG